jgi:hypothetical protein
MMITFMFIKTLTGQGNTHSPALMFIMNIIQD